MNEYLKIFFNAIVACLLSIGSLTYSSETTDTDLGVATPMVTQKIVSLIGSAKKIAGGIQGTLSPITKELGIHELVKDPLFQQVSIMAGSALLTFYLLKKAQERSVQNSSKADLAKKEGILTFKDYAGAIPLEAIDLVEQLKNPEKYEQLKVPVTKGILLYGPPGSGKTYLARAIAGEVNCPFIALNSTDLAQTYYGQAKTAIKKLFADAERAARASKTKTAIIFIDELDALPSRSGSSNNQAFEAETINTLLSEMDGFNQRKDVNIVIIGATNFVNKIDPALQRSGRLDYKIYVPYPSVEGRKKFIENYLKNYPTENTVSADWLTEITNGFSPADIKLLFESSGRIAIRNDKDKRDKKSFEEALGAIRPVEFNQASSDATFNGLIAVVAKQVATTAKKAPRTRRIR